ncbi:helix-turn-helix domain-containing protein [Niallia sp. Marseille-Q9988]
MAVNYNKLWKLLIDKDMNKTQLKDAAKISSNAIAKMGKNETVSIETIVKVCKVLQCDIGDVVEISTNEENKHDKISNKF